MVIILSLSLSLSLSPLPLHSQCSSTGNVFCTLRACIDTCSLPPEIGPCRAAIPAFYYDRSRGACLPFIYGGCQGNDNKFHTIADCLRRCDPNSKRGREGRGERGGRGREEGRERSTQCTCIFINFLQIIPFLQTGVSDLLPSVWTPSTPVWTLVTTSSMPPLVGVRGSPMDAPIYLSSPTSCNVSSATLEVSTMQ